MAGTGERRSVSSQGRPSWPTGSIHEDTEYRLDLLSCEAHRAGPLSLLHCCRKNPGMALWRYFKSCSLHYLSVALYLCLLLSLILGALEKVESEMVLVEVLVVEQCSRPSCRSFPSRFCSARPSSMRRLPMQSSCLSGCSTPRFIINSLRLT